MFKKFGLAVVLLVAATVVSCSAQAQNVESQDEVKVSGNFKADNVLHSGLKVDTSLDLSSGWAGANFGIYSIARCHGMIGTWGVHDCVGVHGTAIKDGNAWIAGGHFDIYDTFSGGTAIGVNIEFPQTQPRTNTIGINIQPYPGARGLVGLQLQNFESFKTGVDMPNMNWIFGDVNGATFGFRFNSTKQALEFFRNIGQRDEARVGVIKMDAEQVQ